MDPEAINVEDLRPDQVAAVVNCVTRCYGDDYPESDFYSVDALSHQIRSGRLISKVAVTKDGQVVGHLGTRLGRLGDPVAETVAGIVDPDYRRRGLLVRLGSAMSKEYRRLELSGIRLFATGAHGLTQRTITSAGGGVTGILLGHIPAGTQYQGIEHAFGDARIGCVVFYQPISKASALRVHLPGCYREIVAQIYRSIGLPRELAACSDAARNDMDISLFVNPKRGSSVLQMGFARDQDELTSTPKSIGEAIGEIRSPVVYVDVRLTHPGAQKAIEELRSYGFCMGCLLPGSRHTEAMRMQRIRGAPIAPERIVVPDGSGREILEFVVNDSVETAVARTSP